MPRVVFKMQIVNRHYRAPGNAGGQDILDMKDINGMAAELPGQRRKVAEQAPGPGEVMECKAIGQLRIKPMRADGNKTVVVTRVNPGQAGEQLSNVRGVTSVFEAGRRSLNANQHAQTIRPKRRHMGDK